MIAWLNSLVMVATAILASRGASLLIFGQTDSRDAIVGLFAGVTASAAGAGCLSSEPAVVSALFAGVLCSLLFRVIVNSDRSNVPCALFSVQFLGGALGALMVGLFALANQSGQHWDGTPISGWIESGNFELLTHQMLAIGATMGLSFVATLFLYQVIKRINKDQNADDRQ
jgi:ammonia channel protein AmtB